ncbi:MAG: HAMP domain-containing sensor histidine kinase [Gammaproteobacteria bacterium]
MTSIQGRLGMWLVGSVILLFGLHWLVMSRAPRMFTEEYVRSRLEHDGEGLLLGLRFEADGQPALDPAYITPIYQRPYSGHYFLILAGNYRLRSRSLWDEDLALPQDVATHSGPWHVTGPQRQPLLLWARRFEKEGREVVIAVGEDLTVLHEHVARFRNRFTVITLVLLLFAVLAQRLMVRLALRPLNQVREDCQRLERGEIANLSENLPLEVRPMVAEINRLLYLMQQRLERSRNALGNLAHALKTPLTLLSQRVEGDAELRDATTLSTIRQAVGSLSGIVNRELKRARLAGGRSPGQRFDVALELASLIALLKRVYAEKGLQYEVVAAEGKMFSGDREDMLELFGNLLDNACKWARTRVHVRVAAGPGLVFSIEDDGPGVRHEVLERLTQRGMRLDESTAGHGLGLSICQDVVRQYQGSITFHRSIRLKGFQVSVRLPEASVGQQHNGV